MNSFGRYFGVGLLHSAYSAALKVVETIKSTIWSNDDSMSSSEDRFLRCLKYTYYRYFVDLDENCRVWTLSSRPLSDHPITENNDDGKPVVLMLHGFVAGLAFWSMNFDCVIDAGFHLYAIDIPGFARSSRVEFSDDALETEKIFIEKIESWRNFMGIKRLIVIGHSMGGYLTSAYALAFPEYVNHIVLVDPWGFPDLREEVTAVIEQGSTQAITAPLLALPVWVRVLVMVLMPFSPFSLIRVTGRFFGPRILHRLRPDMTRRYACIFGDDDYLTVPKYIYHTNCQRPTGEMAFRSMSLPLAWAKEPMIKRISLIRSSIPISFIYGSRSWIDYQTGFEVKRIRSDTAVNVYVIDGAGHHIFADQPDRFNSLVTHIIKGDTDCPEIVEMSSLYDPDRPALTD